MTDSSVMTTEGGLQDRVVIVTGASSGLGEQMARALAAAGGVPVLAARRAAPSTALCAARRGPQAVASDLPADASRRPLVTTVLERHGPLDGLVNNAGA